MSVTKGTKQLLPRNKRKCRSHSSEEQAQGSKQLFLCSLREYGLTGV